jgi:apolipoprotein N-acyltransferase
MNILFIFMCRKQWNFVSTITTFTSTQIFLFCKRKKKKEKSFWCPFTILYKILLWAFKQQKKNENGNDKLQLKLTLYIR